MSWIEPTADLDRAPWREDGASLQLAGCNLLKMAIEIVDLPMKNCDFP